MSGTTTITIKSLKSGTRIKVNNPKPKKSATKKQTVKKTETKKQPAKKTGTKKRASASADNGNGQQHPPNEPTSLEKLASKYSADCNAALASLNGPNANFATAWKRPGSALSSAAGVFN